MKAFCEAVRQQKPRLKERDVKDINEAFAVMKIDSPLKSDGRSK